MHTGETASQPAKGSAYASSQPAAMNTMDQELLRSLKEKGYTVRGLPPPCAGCAASDEIFACVQFNNKHTRKRTFLQDFDCKQVVFGESVPEVRRKPSGACAVCAAAASQRPPIHPPHTHPHTHMGCGSA